MKLQPTSDNQTKLLTSDPNKNIHDFLLREFVHAKSIWITDQHRILSLDLFSFWRLRFHSEIDILHFIPLR